MGVLDSIYEGGGAKPMNWPTVGTTIAGTVVGIREIQATNYKTKQPECWPDGSPKMVPILTVQTELQDDADDDGRRDVYLRGNMFTVFREVLKKVFPKKPSDDDIKGASFKMQFFKTAPSSGGGEPRKLFRCLLEPKPPEPETSADFGWDEPTPEAKQPPAQQRGNAVQKSGAKRRGQSAPPPAEEPPWADEDWASDEDIPFD
jgi:hypothetical protein